VKEGVKEMRLLRLNLVVCALAVTTLAGCGVAQTAVQPALSSAGNARSAAALPGLPRGLAAQGSFRPGAIGAVAGPTWMSPSATSQDLVYVTQLGGPINIFTYPGGQQVGSIGLGAAGECADAKGNVWISNPVGGQLLEYAHGGTSPINTLTLIDQLVISCSVDPATGAIAVDSECQYQSPQCVGPGSVFVYADIKQQPVQYFAGPTSLIYFSSFDPHGNIFADMLNDDPTGFGVFGLAELAKGGSAFKNVKVDREIYFPGGVQWSGKYLAVGDQEAGGQLASSVHQIAIHSGHGKVVSTTRLQGVSDAAEFWIQGSTIVAPDTGIGNPPPGSVRLYPYPAGGAPTLVFGASTVQPQCAVVSLAQK
jgi:hypothetical protein